MPREVTTDTTREKHFPGFLASIGAGPARRREREAPIEDATAPALYIEFCGTQKALYLISRPPLNSCKF